MEKRPIFLIPLTELIDETYLPTDFIEFGGIIDKVFYESFSVEGGPGYLIAGVGVVIIGDVEFPVPLIPGVSLAIGGSEGEEVAQCSAVLELGDVPEWIYEEGRFEEEEEELFWETLSDIFGDIQTPLKWKLSIDAENILRVVFERHLLKPVRKEGEEFRDDEGKVYLAFSGGIVLHNNGEIEAYLGEASEGEGEAASIDIRSPFMIADTGFILDFNGEEGSAGEIRFVFGTVPPEIADRVPPGFRGVYVPRLTVHYYNPRSPGTKLPEIKMEHAALGSGGFTGIITVGDPAPLPDRELEAKLNEVVRGISGVEIKTFPPGATDGRRVLVSRIEDFSAVVYYLSVNFLQSLPTTSVLKGYVYLPFAEKWTEVNLSLGGPDGTLMLELQGLGNEALVDLENEWFEIKADSIEYFVRDGVHYAAINGTVRPKIEGFDWPEFRVERLLVSSEGDVEIDGGWIELPESITLDFYGFRLDVSKVGFGTEEEGSRQWFGLSGNITLVEGLPVSSSVEGLKFSWNKAGDPDLRTTLEGVGVRLEIPDTLRIEGAVSYKEVPPEDGHALSGHIFKGYVSVDLYALKTEVSGDLMIGRVRDASGNEFTVFYIALDADLPAPIPLGASGTAIYGFSGLFGMHVSPDRREDVTWYLWYKSGSEEEGTAYNVATIKKWEPEFDNFAVGAGIVVGTHFDDGWSLNAKALVVVLIPGPVIMIEGRANVLKKRPKSKKEEGSFRALAVLDARADIFRFNVDMRYELSKVASITGEMEAFFDFNDTNAWYLHLGKKEPESKRIQAKILSLFTARTYLMIDSQGVLTGATAGYELKEKFGPARVTLVALMSYDAGIFWNPIQVEGAIDLRGGLGLKVFGIGFELLLRLLLEAMSPKPFRIRGVASVELDLPWPLPDVSVKIELIWEERAEPAPVRPFLKGAAMVHHKLPGEGWPLGTEEWSASVVPVDAVPRLSFSRPVQGLSARPTGTGFEMLPPDRVSGFEFSYHCDYVELAEYVEAGEFPGYRTVMTYPEESGLPSFDADPYSLKPASDAQEPQWQLWKHGPLDTEPLRRRESYTDSYPACEPGPSARCVDWNGIADGTVYPMEFHYRGLEFMTDMVTDGPGGNVITLPPPSVDEGALMCADLTVHFPEPVAWLQIRLKRGDKNKIRKLSFFRNGLPISIEGKWDGDVYTLKAETVKQEFDMVKIAVEHKIGAVAIKMELIRIVQICYRTGREMELARQMERVREEASSGDWDSALVLKPNTLYRITVKTRTQITHNGEVNNNENTKSFYFRTGNGPGANDHSVPFYGTPVDRLETYVDHTIPVNGAASAYFGYDIAVAFNEGYIKNMYTVPLRIRVRDRNGRLLGEPEGDWSGGFIPLLPPGLLTWRFSQLSGNCASSFVKLTPTPYLRRSAPLGLKPNKLYTAEVVTRVNGEDRVLYTFQFTTSRFPNAEAHLRSGQKEGSRQIVRRHPPIPSPALDWLEDYRIAVEAVSDARNDLRRAINNGDLTSIPEKLRACCSAFSYLHRLNKSLFETFAERLKNHNLPPVLEFNALPIQGTEGYVLLIESPEPLDWQRIQLTCRDEDGREVGLAIVWNEDKTRAFIFRSDVTWFNTGVYIFTFEYSGNPEDYPELEPITLNNSTVHHRVNCTVEL